MGVIGFLLGLVVGWMSTSYLVGILTIELPCFYKVAFFCVIGPHIVLALILGYIFSKIFSL